MLLAAISLACLSAFSAASEPGSIAFKEVHGKPVASVEASAVEAPNPWQSAARLRVANERSAQLGSGTVIYSDADRSVILTCAHLFADPGELTVDLFHPEITQADANSPGKLRYRDTFPGRLIVSDRPMDVALVEIKPGRILDASPVLPSGTALSIGDKMTAVGCGEGKDATAWSTSVVRTNVGTKDGGRFTECRNAPKQGRSGGGLFTASGHVAGVCDFASPMTGTGLYASPESIYAICSLIGLEASATGRRCPQGVPCPQMPIPGKRQASEPGLSAIPFAAPDRVADVPPIISGLGGHLNSAHDALPDSTPWIAGAVGIAALILPKRNQAARPIPHTLAA